MDSQWLHKAQATKTTLSIVETSVSPLHMIMLIGKVDWRIVYFCLTNPMTHSAWILLRDNLRASSISILLNCFFPLVYGGIFTSAQSILAASWMLKPRSAKTTSPGKRCLSNHSSLLNVYQILAHPNLLKWKQLILEV